MGASGQPRSSYLICTTPRSGSTLLCELLQATGIAGHPDEYFQHLRSTGCPMTPRDYLDDVATELLPPLSDHEGELEEHALYDPRRFSGFGEYVDWVRQRATSANGVLGLKIMWPYMAGLVDGLSPRRDASPYSVLSEAFPRLRYVWLRRKDKVRQAVSLWRAIQTWQWRQDAANADRRDGEDASGPQLRYSFEAIDHLRRRLISSDRAWEIYFEEAEARPLTLTYENLVDDMHQNVTALMRHVGVAYPVDAHYGIARTARQSDDTSEQWVTGFRADFGAGIPAVG